MINEHKNIRQKKQIYMVYTKILTKKNFAFFMQFYTSKINAVYNANYYFLLIYWEKLPWFQYCAHSGKLRVSHKYTKLRTSFWKHDPPNPTDALRNFDPIRESDPQAKAS